jgi:hypothetical protein
LTGKVSIERIDEEGMKEDLVGVDAGKVGEDRAEDGLIDEERVREKRTENSLVGEEKVDEKRVEEDIVSFVFMKEEWLFSLKV